ncbi:MAG: LysM peptidoglycan-binding domain-containing protein [Anaerolineales bacterium]|nr:LysM peptidoglycan-binding domain-containing protein [Anaerolineales bacterium]
MEKEEAPQVSKNKGFNFDPKKSGTTESYTVKAGDTLTKIAKRIYGESSDSTFQDIYQANKDLIGDDANQIKVGMVLKIPPKK